MPTSTRPLYAQLLSDWEQATREHAQTIREAATAELRQVVSNAPSVADWIRLIDQELTYPGPWVRAYDSSARGGDGAYVWINGRTVIADHAVAEAHMTGDRWDDINRLSVGWPAKPCSESYTEFPAEDNDPQSYGNDAESSWCPGCESTVPLVRYNDVWERPAHTVDGKLIDPLA